MLSGKNISEIFWLVFGQLVSMILGIISIKILTSMGPSEYGKYVLVGTLMAFLSALLYGPAEQGFIRFYFYYANKGFARTYINYIYKFLTIAAFFFLFLCCIAISVNYMLGTPEKHLFIFFAAIFMIVSASTTPFSAMLNLLRKRKVNALIKVIERALSVALLFLLFKYSNLSLLSALFVLSITIIIFIVIKIYILNRFIPDDNRIWQEDTASSIRLKLIADVKKFSLPFCIWGGFGWLQSNSEGWVIVSFLSAGDVGRFGLMIAVANYLIAIPSGIIAQFAIPIIYKRFSVLSDQIQVNKGQLSIRYLVVSTIILVILSTSMTACLGKEVIFLLSSDKFLNYYYLLPFVCFAVGLFHIGQSLTTIGMSLNMPEEYVTPKVITGVLAVLMNIVFIKLLGIDGIVFSLCTIGMVYLILICRSNSKIKSKFISSVLCDDFGK